MRRRFINIGGENVIYYTSINGKIIAPYGDIFEDKIISNTYNNDVGKIKFKGKITTIDSNLFFRRSTLKTITIPNSVTSIGDEAFYDCTSLISVYCKATTPPALGNTYVFVNNASGRKIYVPYQSLNAYKTAEYWSEYAADIVGYDFENDTVVSGVEFPIYLKFDYCEDLLGGGVSCYRNPDEISIELRNYLLEKLAKYGTSKGGVFTLSENALASLNIHIYIEELRVIEISCYLPDVEFEPVELVLDGWYNDLNRTYLTSDGSLSL